MTRVRSAARSWLWLIQGQNVGASREVEDEALIEAIERGDRRLGDALYLRLSRVVETAIYRVVGPGDPEHDDLVQAAFEQIVTTIVRRKFAKACSLSSWASAVTCNVALNALRSRKADRKVFDRAAVHEEVVAERLVDAAGGEARLDAQRNLERIRTHLAQMSPTRAETLLLHDLFGKELSEIAVLTGTSVAAAQSRLVRGRAELFERLARDGVLPSGGTT